MILHWLQKPTLPQWLNQHASLIGEKDSLLLSDNALAELPEQTPCSQPLYALKQDLDNAHSLPDYVRIIDDEHWVKLVLKHQQQITW